MFPAFTLPMNAERSRNKERLEASLAGLCELELLKQRQECRVLSALCPGDSPVPGRLLSLCVFQSSLQCTPWDINTTLEQQVSELKVNTEVKSTGSPNDLKDNELNSGEVLAGKQTGSSQLNYQSVVTCSLSASFKGTGETWLSDAMRQTMATNALEMRDVDSSQEDYQQAQKVKTYIFRLIQRRALPTRPLKPRTSLAHDARAISMLKQNNLCHKEAQHSPKQVSVQVVCSPQCLEETASQASHNLDQECYLGKEFAEDDPPPNHHLHERVQHQTKFCQKPRQASMINTPCSISLEYPSCRVLKVHPDSSNSESDSPQHFNNYPSPLALSQPHRPLCPDEQLVSAEYIPAQPCRASMRTYAYTHSNPLKGSGIPKTNENTFSPEKGHYHHLEQQPTSSHIQPSRCRGGPKKCRSHEDRNGASRKLGKKACRSQSENSLQRVPERKYNTVERDGGGSGSGGKGSRSSQSKSKKQQGSGSYLRWQSTLELSQDEACQSLMHGSLTSNQRDHCARRARKSRSTHTSYAYPHRNHSHHHSSLHQHINYQLEREKVPMCHPTEDYPHPGQGESESSMSEADSLDSSSLSSDSDESGGLVWPQQLPPQLSFPSSSAPHGAPLQPKAFVKIKASHALKKKILRFRTGSLKVMTTV
uniref:Dishevelled-binding antagonist of beta-catenin 3a n=1 Tax=Mastacembelus armatus TaxID=205130 RepID=A0A3Q3NG08_9TELE